MLGPDTLCVAQDLSSLDDQQRFDGFLEKVTLSALDPTDDELISDIIAGAPLTCSLSHSLTAVGLTCRSRLVDDSLDVETPVA